jgi:hypothetical protein
MGHIVLISRFLGGIISEENFITVREKWTIARMNGSAYAAQKIPMKLTGFQFFNSGWIDCPRDTTMPYEGSSSSRKKTSDGNVSLSVGSAVNLASETSCTASEPRLL